MTPTSKSNGTTGLASLVIALAGTLLVSAASLSVFQNTSLAGGSGSRSGTDDSTGDEDGDWSSDDEVIGTLPSMGDPNDDELLAWLLGQEPPSFFIQGRSEELIDSIFEAGPAAFDADAFTTYETLRVSRDHSQDLVRITFHGAVNVGFDASLMNVSDFECGLSLGASFDAFGAGIISGERVLSTTIVQSQGELTVPFAYLHSLDLLNGLQIVTSAGKGVRTVVDVIVRGGTVSLEQRDLAPSKSAGATRQGGWIGGGYFR